MDKNFIDIVNSFCPHGELLRAEVLPGGYSSDVYILHVKVDDKEVRFVLRSEGSPRSENTINTCLLYTSPSPRDKRQSRMPSSA